MSGHFLSTINPEAAEAIDAPDVVSNLPDIGTSVVYLSRPGEGRAGKMEFPAIVLHHERQGGLYLLVIYAVDDMVERPNVPQYSEDTPFPAWRHIQGAEPEAFEPSRLNIMRKDLDEAWQTIHELRKKLDETIHALYGEWAAPTGSIMDYMVKFEGMLKELKASVAEKPASPSKGKK